MEAPVEVISIGSFVEVTSVEAFVEATSWKTDSTIALPPKTSDFL